MKSHFETKHNGYGQNLSENDLIDENYGVT